MAFGIYIHIPYCLQRCVYCDFATYEFGKIDPPEKYLQLLTQEIGLRSKALSPLDVDTIYFGGGTPSLLEPQQILSVLSELRNNGLTPRPAAEITIEINPATISPSKIEAYLKGGINRFSVGVQTFREDLLKLAGRRHSAEDSHQTLKLLRDHKVDFSADILFALPHQSQEDLKRDIEAILQYEPVHISPYCLTVPETNPMSKNRPLDEDQVEMFSLLDKSLSEARFDRYEISNYARSGFESKHNLLYWTDQEYWGLGVGAHSYLKREAWGVRFWNPRSYNDYKTQIENLKTNNDLPYTHLENDQKEFLNELESLSDFCHTSLRMKKGLSLELLENKFGTKVGQLVVQDLQALQNKGYLESQDSFFRLTSQGVLLSNYVFEVFTYS